MKKVFYAVSLIVLLTSCGKKAVEIDENFIGKWQTRNSSLSCNIETLNIYSEGDGEWKASGYYDIGGPPEDPKDGTIRIRGDELCIGLFKSFTINEFPSSEDKIVGGDICQEDFLSDAYMVLDGEKFYRNIGDPWAVEE